MVIRLLTFKMRSIISFTSFNLLNFFCFIPVPPCKQVFTVVCVYRCSESKVHNWRTHSRAQGKDQQFKPYSVRWRACCCPPYCIPGPTYFVHHTPCADWSTVVHRTAFPDQLILYTILPVLTGLLLSTILHSRTNPLCTPYSMCWLVYCCPPYCIPGQTHCVYHTEIGNLSNIVWSTITMSHH